MSTIKTTKNILIGIIIGIIISSSVSFGSDIIKNSYFNSNLKLAINNQEIPDIRIVTVEVEGERYGRNYYSIADLIKAINDYGGISAKVDYDSSTQTTIVEIGEKPVSTMSTITPTPTLIPTPKAKKHYIENPRKIPDTLKDIPDATIDDNGEETFVYNGIKYITENSIKKIINNINENFKFSPVEYDKGLISNIKNFKAIAEFQIIYYQDTHGYWKYCADYDYFKDIVIPFIEQWED